MLPEREPPGVFDAVAGTATIDPNLDLGCMTLAIVSMMSRGS